MVLMGVYNHGLLEFMKANTSVKLELYYTISRMFVWGLVSSNEGKEVAIISTWLHAEIRQHVKSDVLVTSVFEKF